MPNDGGTLLLNDDEKKEILNINPELNKFIKPFLSVKEFINNTNRWCLWLVDVDPGALKGFTKVMERIEAVKNHRANSDRMATKKLALYSTLVGEIRQANSNYIMLPRHSSENRKYIPLGYFSKDYIVADSCLSISKTSKSHFGVLTSEMHMAWVKQVWVD
jgi:hypothetical protein